MLQLDSAILAARFNSEIDVIVPLETGILFCAGADISTSNQ